MPPGSEYGEGLATGLSPAETIGIAVAASVEGAGDDVTTPARCRPGTPEAANRSETIGQASVAANVAR
jgi:hypothetical protein